MRARITREQYIYFKNIMENQLPFIRKDTAEILNELSIEISDEKIACTPTLTDNQAMYIGTLIIQGSGLEYNYPLMVSTYLASIYTTSREEAIVPRLIEQNGTTLSPSFDSDMDSSFLTMVHPRHHGQLKTTQTDIQPLIELNLLSTDNPYPNFISNEVKLENIPQFNLSPEPLPPEIIASLFLDLTQGVNSSSPKNSIMTVTSENNTNINTPTNTNSKRKSPPPSEAESSDESQETSQSLTKKEKNCLSAKRYRKKRKEELEQLEALNENLQKTFDELKAQLRHLNANHALLKFECKKLEKETLTVDQSSLASLDPAEQRKISNRIATTNLRRRKKLEYENLQYENDQLSTVIPKLQTQINRYQFAHLRGNNHSQSRFGLFNVVNSNGTTNTQDNANPPLTTHSKNTF